MPTRKTKTTRPAKPPRKQTTRETSNEVSSDSARLLALGGRFFHERTVDGFAVREQVTKKIKAALASCVNQDQTKGRRRPITLRDLVEEGLRIDVVPKDTGIVKKAHGPRAKRARKGRK